MLASSEEPPAGFSFPTPQPAASTKPALLLPSPAVSPPASAWRVRGDGEELPGSLATADLPPLILAQSPMLGSGLGRLGASGPLPLKPLPSRLPTTQRPNDPAQQLRPEGGDASRPPTSLSEGLADLEQWAHSQVLQLGGQAGQHLALSRDLTQSMELEVHSWLATSFG
ncbi:hypothetical protein QJQ45_012655 [Haematococcus lacustris]|nr:hypothetical protein QJQ45_012655 [Haematococcus lacustris]